MRAALLALLLAAPARAAQRPGFLVLALDRGFLGNEETREAFERYRAGGFLAELALLGRGEDPSAREALARLKAAGAARVTALPLAVSAAQGPLKRALSGLGPSVEQGSALAGHYLAAELLADRIARLSRDPGGEALVLAAQAFSEEEAAAVEGDLRRTAAMLPSAFARVEAVALVETVEFRGYSSASRRRLEDALASARKAGLSPVLVPFDLGTKLDSMMAFSSYLAPAAARHGAAYAGEDLSPHECLSLWLSQESNRRLPADPRALGVVFMPHGSSERWNRVMREAVAPLAKRWMIEPAFSMADPAVIERAVRRLEARGARRIHVLRVFSLAESFRAQTERALGLAPPADPHEGHHGHHGPPASVARIRSSAALSASGGIEDSPLFAEALYDRARAVSRDPARETVFLLAHGSGDDAENERWREILASLGAQLQALAEARGTRFKEVRSGTWREDWPEKHAPELSRIRAEVAAAARDGRALVLPARTAEGGPEPQFLKGLDYLYNPDGFAPHPAFARWVEERVREAAAAQ